MRLQQAFETCICFHCWLSALPAVTGTKGRNSLCTSVLHVGGRKALHSLPQQVVSEAVERDYAEAGVVVTAEHAMAGQQTTNVKVRRRESARTLVVFVFPSRKGSQSPDTEYSRSFLRQKLIRGWIAIFSSATVLGLLITSLLGRLF
jgi:hypothetical protein